MYGSVVILRNPIDGGGDPNDCENDNDLVVVHLNSCYKLDAVNFSLLKSLTIDCTTAIIKLDSTKHLRYVKQFS